jgi:cytochrome c oxidase subunit II
MRWARWLAALAISACAGTPSYLRAYGPVAVRQARLGWFLLIVAAAVVAVMGLLVIVATVRRRAPAESDLLADAGGLGWVLVGGIAVPVVILAAVLVVSTGTLAAVARAPAHPAATIRITGHQWWWEIRYDGSTPDEIFTTANELHLPVGQPVRLELATADVIHSFWVPQLAGKLDLNPGQTNSLWIQADSAGTYHGQCGEYCGLQHAGMALSVVAEPPAQFARWLEAMRQPAPEPAGGDPAAGRQVFTGSACALCHTVRGTEAGGALGPDLTHVAARRTLAAGMLPNRTGELTAWIADPQAVKPGAKMPAVPLGPDELRQIVAYLQTLH